MLFLGAGASAAFGVPTMQQLTESCEKLLLERGYPEARLSKIKSSLKRYGFVPDFEGMLTILDAFVTPYKGVAAAGPLAAYLADLSSEWPPQKKDPPDHLRELKRMLSEKCLQANMDDAINCYNKLFSTLAEVQRSIRVDKTRASALKGGVLVPGDKSGLRTQDIFTTNYDLVIEKYFDHRAQMRDSLKHGFVLRGNRMVWDPRHGFGYGWDQEKTNLVKLHGSIDQSFFLDGIEKRQVEPDKGFYQSPAFERMMIFPVHEKYATHSPYYDLLSLLRQRLAVEPVCVVIGFSFRDEAVNNAFVDALKENPDLKIVYIGGEDAHKNIQEIKEVIFKTRTKVIPLEFDSDGGYINELGVALTEWYPEHY